MKKDIKTYDQLFLYLNQCIRSSLESHVLDEVRNTLYKNIYTYVYHKYEPKEYSRKQDRGGLSDKDNMIFDKQLLLKNKLVVRSIRDAVNEDTGRFVDAANIVQTGKGYTRTFPYKGIPRNYTKITKAELAKKKSHVHALKKGLKGLGLKVRG